MRWRKRDLWKASIAIACLLLLLLLMTWVPLSAVSAHEGLSGLATPGTVTVQATPTEDATVTALNKEKLQQEVQQLKNPTQNQNNWFLSNSAALIAAFSGIAVAVFGIIQWTGTVRQAKDKDRKDRAEERFKTAVTALGDEKEGVQVGGAILLGSFLHKEDKKSYERYYTQIFDLAVAYLRLPRTSPLSEDPDGIPQSPVDPNIPLPPTTLRSALAVVFKEAFPLVRDSARSSQEGEKVTRELLPLQSFNANGVQLDGVYFAEADLKQVWMPGAFLRNIDLNGANLCDANLSGANLCGASLVSADLQRVRLRSANLCDADLCNANLEEARLSGANLRNANLGGVPREQSTVKLSGTIRSTVLPSIGAKLSRANLSGADLSGANLDGTDLSGANLQGANLHGVHLEDADSLEGTNLCGVKGLTEEQLAVYEAKGATIRKYLNIALVIDHSDSMKDEELKNVRETAKMIIDHLKPTDYISAVIFNDTAQVIIPSMPANDKPGMKAAIDKIEHAGGKTMSLGMIQGLDELRRWGLPGAVTCMILLTDGVTVGDIDRCRQLARDAATADIAIYPLGIGSNWDRSLLDDIGQLSGGIPAMFVRTPEDAMSIFRIVQKREIRLKQGTSPIERRREDESV